MYKQQETGWGGHRITCHPGRHGYSGARRKVRVGCGEQEREIHGEARAGKFGFVYIN